MKQRNNSSNNLVTKPFFKKELKREFGVFEERFEKRMEKKFVTKDYFKTELNDTIDRLLQGIRREITFSAEVVTEKLERRLTKHTNLILTTIYPLLKELETRRQDREIASDQSIKVEKKLDNHEKRIGKLEHAQQAA